MGSRELYEIRKIALGLPGVNERTSHGAPCFFVRDKKPLCYFHDEFHGHGRISLWCPAPPGVQETLVGAEPDRFFRPTPSASGVFKNWLGMYLDPASDSKIDWEEVADILEDAYRHIAPKKLVKLLDQSPS